ncbi:DinB family protein [Hymenobacter sp. YC55]|uniref:DinB family protein n=1 Tax=Hymenobacter sp. YC55 TaxID=3034019 RepID=UPI0023F6BE9E|nr:DinB family protein [Hymenobacter sp. YC55]MDF7813820.1 DinB family protein [Hymenobacter sp. YC55]
MNHEKTIVDLVVNQFEGKVQQTSAVFTTLGAEAAQLPVAPDRNTVGYLLGHLVAVHDKLLEGLSLGERLHPEWDSLFLAPQQNGSTYPAYQELLGAWQQVNAELGAGFATLTVADWLTKHAYVSDEDFAREPHRNKLNLLLSRTGHLFHHGGQLVLVKR